MRAELEITGAVIRVFEDDAPYGTPFAEVLSLVGDEGEAILKGLKGTMSRPLWEAVRDALIRAGFHTATWRRRRAGRVIPVRFAVPEVAR